MIPTPTFRSHSQMDFSRIQTPQIQRSGFARPWKRTPSFDPGWLVPIYVEEVLPGDTINMKISMVARLATLLYPIMDSLYLDTFWFYCPNRILWDKWKRFNGERSTPEESIDITIPVLAPFGEELAFEDFGIGDYLGLPIGIPIPTGGVPGAPGISALPFRMYNLIWNEWFRSQSTQGPAYFSTGDGPDTLNNFRILNRGKRHDYFSSCLPWPQKGDAVALPLGTLAPIVGDGTAIRLFDGVNGAHIQYDDTNGNGFLRVTGSGGAQGAAPSGTAPSGDAYLGGGTNTHLFADLSGATAATINDLREAIAIQQLLELDARGGTRYVEQLQAMWGVTVPDYRLQRPEYLGGSSDPMGIHAVAQTAPGSTPQAQLSAFGQMQAMSSFSYSAVEHGYIMCLVNVRAEITYQQGIHKMWQRSTRYDFYQPPLAHLGEQAVLNRELYFTGTDTDQEVFGYQERWSEYRYSYSYVSGAFRSSYTQSLDSWHLALKFTALPELIPDAGAGFVVDDPPVERVVAVKDKEGEAILLDVAAKADWVRPMPVRSTPGLERI